MKITKQTINKIKELKKKGKTPKEISIKLKLAYSLVLYHYSDDYRKKSIERNKKTQKENPRRNKENYKKYQRKYQNKRYKEDEEFREKIKKWNREYQKRKYDQIKYNKKGE
jgi:hypothetical protein